MDRIQEILFENKESIPDGVYLQLMNALVAPKPKDYFYQMKKDALNKMIEKDYMKLKNQFFKKLRDVLNLEDFHFKLQGHQLHDLVIVNANTYGQYVGDVNELFEEFKSP
jgi:hypothetical protein